jgi:hypothetical protein
VATLFARFPQIEWLTTLCPLVWDESGLAVRTALRHRPYTRRRFFRGEHSPGWLYGGRIQQESTFWRRSLWERAGGRIDASLALAGDFELWARFYRHAELYSVTTPLGGFRIHPDQKTARHLAAYAKEARDVLTRAGGRPPGRLRAYARLGIRQITPTLGLNMRRRLPILGKRYPSHVCEYVFREGWRIL